MWFLLICRRMRLTMRILWHKGFRPQREPCTHRRNTANNCSTWSTCSHRGPRRGCNAPSPACAKHSRQRSCNNVLPDRDTEWGSNSLRTTGSCNSIEHSNPLRCNHARKLNYWRFLTDHIVIEVAYGSSGICSCLLRALSVAGNIGLHHRWAECTVQHTLWSRRVRSAL